MRADTPHLVEMTYLFKLNTFQALPSGGTYAALNRVLKRAYAVYGLALCNAVYGQEGGNQRGDNRYAQHDQP